VIREVDKNASCTGAMTEACGIPLLTVSAA